MITIPKEIVEKAEKYAKLKQITDELYEDLESYFNDLEGDDAVYRGSYTVVDKPSGELLESGCYCDQIRGGEDFFVGTFYYPTQDGRYIAYYYST